MGAEVGGLSAKGLGGQLGLHYWNEGSLAELAAFAGFACSLSVIVGQKSGSLVQELIFGNLKSFSEQA